MKTNHVKWDVPKVKYFGIPLEKAAKGSDGTISVKGYFTSDNRDMMGDMISRGATERAIPAYKRWGNIRYMHLPKPVAKVVRIGVEDGLAWNEVEIKVIDPQAVFEVENGLLAALSVGILVNFDDVEFMEDGGMLINDYLLAEISLVDHPANYDAALTGVKGMFQSLAELDKQSALRTLDEMKAVLSQGETDMADNAAQTEPKVEQPVEAPAEEVVQKEAPVTETEPAAEEVAVEAPVSEQPVEVEKAAEEAPAEETPAEEAPAEVDPVLEAVKSLSIAVAEMAVQITNSITALAASIEASKAVTQEATAEAQVATEQSVSEEKALSEEEEVESADETGLPVNRVAAVPPTEPPTEPVELPVKEEKKDLRTALRKYFDTK